MRLAALCPSLLLAACATTAPADPVISDPVVANPAGSCRNDGRAAFVGQPATSELGARMLSQSGARTLRWVAKGTMITMEFSADRLTVYLDAANRVERANCG